MSKTPTIGIIVPHADDRIPPEGPQMYPEVDVRAERRWRAVADAGGLRSRR